MRNPVVNQPNMTVFIHLKRTFVEFDRIRPGLEKTNAVHVHIKRRIFCNLYNLNDQFCLLNRLPRPQSRQRKNQRGIAPAPVRWNGTDAFSGTVTGFAVFKPGTIRRASCNPDFFGPGRG